MLRKIQEIDGIDTSTADLLRQAGINTTGKLLEVGGKRDGRKSLAAKTSINEETILDWVNICDLYRISGINRRNVSLLKDSGVDTLRELRSRNAHDLFTTLEKQNERNNHCVTAPSLQEVSRWIEQAKIITPRVFH